MPELSKTARASTVKEVKQVKVETTEQAIAALRADREAHIWPNCERIDKLLAAYDALKIKVDAFEKEAATPSASECEAYNGWGSTAPTIDAAPVAEHQHEIDRMADEGCPHA